MIKLLFNSIIKFERRVYQIYQICKNINILTCNDYILIFYVKTCNFTYQTN